MTYGPSQQVQQTNQPLVAPLGGQYPERSKYLASALAQMQQQGPDSGAPEAPWPNQLAAALKDYGHYRQSRDATAGTMSFVNDQVGQVGRQVDQVGRGVGGLFRLGNQSLDQMNFGFAPRPTAFSFGGA
jgi:hypothetical protein